MTLEEQFALMKEFYDRGQLVVRLHTGDPCIYGAIQEQMNFFDQYGIRTTSLGDLFISGCRRCSPIPIHHSGEGTDHHPHSR